MGTSYRIDAQLRTLFIRASGVLRDEDLGLLWRSIISDPEMRPDLNELADYTRVTASTVTTRFVWDLTDSFRRFDRVRSRQAKVAVVAKLDVLYGLALMSETLSEPSPVQYRTFRDVSEAREWLGLPLAATDAGSSWKEVEA
jgi:hypothetical protein